MVVPAVTASNYGVIRLKYPMRAHLPDRSSRTPHVPHSRITHSIHVSSQRPRPAPTPTPSRRRAIRSFWATADGDKYRYAGQHVTSVHPWAIASLDLRLRVHLRVLQDTRVIAGKNRHAPHGAWIDPWGLVLAVTSTVDGRYLRTHPRPHSDLSPPSPPPPPNPPSTRGVSGVH